MTSQRASKREPGRLELEKRGSNEKWRLRGAKRGKCFTSWIQELSCSVLQLTGRSKVQVKSRAEALGLSW